MFYHHIHLSKKVTKEMEAGMEDIQVKEVVMEEKAVVASK